MIIRKKFKFEAAHIVRNCSTERCKKNIHGHSFIVEVFLQSRYLDNAGMVMDFNLFKPYVKDFIDSFDHSYIYWERESQEFQNFIQQYNERYIKLPFSPSAENLAIFFHYWIEEIIQRTLFNNGEVNISVKSVRVHETDTGYAETEGYRDTEQYIPELTSMTENNFSKSIRQDWQDRDMFRKLCNEEGYGKVFSTKVIEQQIK